MTGSTIVQPIVFQPGIRRDLTQYMAEGGWYDCDKIRFRNGRAEKMGGWVKETVSQAVGIHGTMAFTSGFSSGFETSEDSESFTGIPRAGIDWNGLDSKKYLMIAGTEKVEIFHGNQIYDVTPARATSSLTDAITTDGTSIVNITDVNHDATEGDYVVFSNQGSAVDGITLSGQYVVLEVIDNDNYIVQTGITASGSSSLDGGSLDITYLLENGPENNGNLTGWSGGAWDTPGEASGGWGMPRAGVGGLNLRQWSLDTWGEDALACVRGGKIYQWDASAGLGTRMTPLTNAPDTNSFVLVSQPSRHVIAFGSETFATGIFDPLIIRWAEEETLDGWDITDINTAGEWRLPSGNYIVGAVHTRSEILVFTDTEVYSMRFIGGVDVFNVQALGSNVSVISQNAFCDINGVIFWAGIDNFYMYDGVVRILPSTLGKFLFDQDGEGRINLNQKEKAYMGVIKETNEFILFYPRFDSEENNAYVKYNYIEQVWDFGTLNRTVWVDKGVFSKPYGLTETGVLYVHEEGKDADAIPLEAYIQSAYFDIGDGQNLLFVDKVLPDIHLANNRNIQISLYFKKYPHPGSDVTTKGPYYFDDSMGKISVRGRGRQMAIKYLVDSTGSDFEIGKVRVAIQPDGGR